MSGSVALKDTKFPDVNVNEVDETLISPKQDNIQVAKVAPMSTFSKGMAQNFIKIKTNNTEVLNETATNNKSRTKGLIVDSSTALKTA